MGTVALLFLEGRGPLLTLPPVCASMGGLNTMPIWVVR